MDINGFSRPAGSRRPLGRVTAAVVLACLAGGSPGPAMAAAPMPEEDAQALTLQHALTLAMRHAPALRADDLELAAARDAAVPAGELPDPKIWFGVDSLPVEGRDRFSFNAEPMTMVGLGISQALPNRGKRAARAAAAAGRVELAEAELQVTRATVLKETAVAWIEAHTLRTQLERVEELYAENRLFAAAVRARHAGGRGAASDLVAPRQEAVRLDELRDRLSADRQRADANLARWIGAAAQRPLAGAVPEWPVASQALLPTVHLHPDFRAFESQARVLAAEVREAEAARRPDWEVEFAWQQRDARFGDMVMLRVGMDLPLRPGRRQNPEIAARRARQAALEAERESVLRAHTAMAAADIADYRRLDAAARRLREVALPLAEEKVALMVADWRSGQVTLTDVVAARRERIETRLRHIAVTGERHAVAARLHFAYGELAVNGAPAVGRRGESQ